MKFSVLFAPFVLMSCSAFAVTVSYDPSYGDASRPLTDVACSDGANGLITAGFATLGRLPKFPSIGGTDNVAGWNSPQCGTCWNLAYTDAKNVTRSINVLAVDHVNAGWTVAPQALDMLTGGLTVQIGRINNVTEQQVDKSQCGF